MKKMFFFLLTYALHARAGAQELYVYSEPASNMPAHSLSTRVVTNFGEGHHGGQMQRYTPELMFGFSKKLMVHLGTSFSNMYTPNTRWESVYAYGKYRLLSVDDIHKHFRVAVFAEAAYSRNDYYFEEISLQGDRSGVQAGIIATQLLNKLAVSGTVSHTQAFDPSRYDEVAYMPKRTYSSLNYTLSAGYLVLPRVYKNYDQLNLNVYTELIGQRTLDRKTFYVDLAPAVQLIFSSNTKLNLGYRFQLNGNQFRNMEKSYLVSLEHTFFNLLKRRKS
ncbi:MAG TPA: hypothetical protein VFR58_06970 [Flavisolibacter sp.]|nr:hypothetical protein [Flavisolibacter sp.]